MGADVAGGLSGSLPSVLCALVQVFSTADRPPSIAVSPSLTNPVKGEFLSLHPYIDFGERLQLARLGQCAYPFGPVTAAREWSTVTWAESFAHPHRGEQGLFKKKAEEKHLEKIFFFKEYLLWLTIMCFEEFKV